MPSHCWSLPEQKQIQVRISIHAALPPLSYTESSNFWPMKIKYSKSYQVNCSHKILKWFQMEMIPTEKPTWSNFSYQAIKNNFQLVQPETCGHDSWNNETHNTFLNNCYSCLIKNDQKIISEKYSELLSSPESYSESIKTCLKQNANPFLVKLLDRSNSLWLGNRIIQATISLLNMPLQIAVNQFYLSCYYGIRKVSPGL